MRWLRAVIAMGGLVLAGVALAHGSHQSLLSLHLDGEGRLQGRWELQAQDPAGPDGPHGPTAAKDLLARLRLHADGRDCPLSTQQAPEAGASQRVVEWGAACGKPARTFTVDLRALFEADPRQLVLLRIDAGAQQRSAVLSADVPALEFSREATHWSRQLAGNLLSGIWHIWIGFDHVLFLLALLLPAVLARAGEGTRSLGAVSIEVTKVVTAFTVAHSVTLTAAALGWVAPPPRLVESVIALSVLLAALFNLRASPRARWPAAFAFGLVHGFGFATALADAGLGGSVALMVLGFNLGVELGQLAIVLVFVPIAFSVRKTSWYRTGLVRGGSAIIALVALAWFVERAFDLPVAAAFG